MLKLGVYVLGALGPLELMVRLPSVLAGTACCWLAYLWLKEVTDRSTAFMGLLLFSFAPSLIGLSAEVRQYALLLFFMAGCPFLSPPARPATLPTRLEPVSPLPSCARSPPSSSLLFSPPLCFLTPVP